MELTKEEFNSAIANLATKDDLSKMATKVEISLELENQTKELKKFAEDQTETLARMVSSQVVKDLEDKLNMAVRMALLENQMSEIRSALHLNPSR